MKNTLEGINSRITDAEEGTSDLEDRMVEITSKEQNIEKINEKKKLRQPKGSLDIIKLTSIHIIGRGPRKRRERERTQENI